MRRFKQAHLAASSSQTLCVVRPPKYAITDGENLTLRLPDEVLAEIFQYLAPQDRDERQNARCLLFMSRRWHKLYEPAHYQCLDLGYQTVEIRWRLTKLLRTLKDRPDLARYVRRVPITMYKPQVLICEMFTELLGRCGVIRHIHMQDAFNSRTTLVLDAVLNFDRLESLHLAGSGTELSLPTFSRVMSLPRLKSLELYRYGRWPVSEPSLSDYLKRLIPVNCYRTGPITKLSISDPHCSSEVYQRIALWPARLTYFSLTFLHHSGFGQSYTLAAVQKMLHSFRDSIKNISLGYLECFGLDENFGIPDFSQFTSLETLNVMAWNFFRQEPSVTMSRLSPSLTYVDINFSPQDQHGEGLADFGHRQCEWFSEFAASKRLLPQARLQHIHLQYNPELYPSFSGIENTPWPWDYIDQAQKTLYTYDIRLTCTSEAKVSKEEWIQQWKEMENASTYGDESSERPSKESDGSEHSDNESD